MTLLDVKDVSIAYGSLQAVWNAEFDIGEKELVTIVGSNGSGKSTLLKAISGLLKPIGGTITFLGQRIDGMLPNKIVSVGLVHVPEGRHLFPEMTVQENLELGAYDKTVRDKRNESFSFVYQYFPILEKMGRRLAGTLSGGEQQMLAIGRGMMAKPKLLMLDEPSLGLAPMMVKELFEIIQRLSGEGVPILLVEQNVRYSLKLAHRGYVLESGRVIMSGKGKDLLENEDIMKAYLAG
jgi:branched-chain amino acid transport system ATP-binding protein